MLHFSFFKENGCILFLFVGESLVTSSIQILLKVMSFNKQQYVKLKKLTPLYPRAYLIVNKALNH